MPLIITFGDRDITLVIQYARAAPYNRLLMTTNAGPACTFSRIEVIGDFAAAGRLIAHSEL